MTDLVRTGWPFWAPSDLASVEAALDLAGLAPGERLVDLGCGDGQVLVAAGRRGAHVTGIEVDEDLAAHAEDALAANGLEGEVHVGDLFDFDLDAEVLFTYLAPATLQRLVPTFQAQTPGTRLVTVDFAVPGLEADRVRGRTHRYVLPAPPLPPLPIGWPAAGALVAAAAGVESLTCLEAGHPAGPVVLSVGGGIAGVAAMATGAEVLDADATLAVDVRWRPCDAGTVATGTVDLAGAGVLSLTVVFTDDDDEQGVWDLTGAAARSVASAVRRRNPPRSVDDLLAVAEA